MFQQTQPQPSLPPNYLQFHENAFVSPLNLINVTHPAPISFGRAPHLLQQTIPRIDPSMSTSSSSTFPHQSIDTNKMHMYEFLAQRKLKEDRWKKEMDGKNPSKQTPLHQRSIRSSQTPQQQQRAKNSTVRSTSAPKKPVATKKPFPNETIRTPTPIHFSRPADPLTALSTGKQNEVADVHEQLLGQLRTLHNPSARENIIDETEQEKQRRIRLKRERIKRDSRAVYNAHQELKQILQEIRQPDANLSRLLHRHLNAYRAVLTAVETLANESPLKPQDVPVQQLLAAILPVLEILTNVNHAFGFSQLHIDSTFLHNPPSKSVRPRTAPEHRVSPSNQLLPSIYNELIKKKQRKPRTIPSVLRPRSAESVRLPRTDPSTITRPTISMQHKTRARSHSPLPSIKSTSTTETPFYSRFTVDDILVRLAPRLLANYTGRELSDQIERARTLIPMFLVDNRLNDEEIVQRVLQMLMPRQQQPPTQQLHSPIETAEERARRVNIDVYQTQITTWEDEMSQIRQRLQNYRTNRLEEDTTATTTRRMVRFQVDSPSPSVPVPEGVQIHAPLFEYTVDGFVQNSTENKPAFERTFAPRRHLPLNGLDSHKVRQIEKYRNDYKSYLRRTESAKTEDFDPAQVINRLSEFLLDEALLSVVQEVELLTVELSQKLVENELLGREISLADVEKNQSSRPYRQPIQPMGRKHSPISFSPPIEQYNTSSFEEDLNTESQVSRDEDQCRKSPMEGTGRFTTAAFEQRKLPRNRSASSSSASSSSAHLPQGIIIKPTVPRKQSTSVYDSDHDVNGSNGRDQQRRRSSSGGGDDDEEDEELLLSTKTGEKIYSTDFEESKGKLRNMGNDDDEDDDDDVADTLKLSARSLNAMQHSSFGSDDDDD